MYTFFWHGPFSQWHPSIFCVDGIRYYCAEQYMMAQKAVIFNDYQTLSKIMSTRNPKEQKALGRKVTGFDSDIWEHICQDIVYRGNLAKFSQNDSLRVELLKTVGTALVEASPYDKVWGIGLGPEDPLRLDPSNWKGTNYLGLCLMRVREALFKESP